MNFPEAEFHESTARRRIEKVGQAHLSIELGHFSHDDDNMSDYAYLCDHFRRIAPWVRAARERCAAMVSGSKPRIKTCILVDDYFAHPAPPRVLVPVLVEAAATADLVIDHIARESGLADPAAGAAGSGVPPAELVQARLVEDPPPNSTGTRPPVSQTGWLCNGQRTPPQGRQEAMKEAVRWTPPVQNSARNHSIFVDIELWNSAKDGRRRWSCAMLASVWQLVRLGMIRDNGHAVAVARALPAELPHDWSLMPPVVSLQGDDAALGAHRTLTICPSQFLPVEHAVRTILDRVAVDPTVLDQIAQRAASDGIDSPVATVDRIDYVFLSAGPVRRAGPG